MTSMTRRRALALGAGLAGTGLLRGTRASAAPLVQKGTLPAAEIQKIVGIEGTVTDGVLGMSPERKDLGKVVGPLGVHLRPSFELNGDLYFQPLGAGRALLQRRSRAEGLRAQPGDRRDPGQRADRAGHAPALLRPAADGVVHPPARARRAARAGARRAGGARGVPRRRCSRRPSPQHPTTPLDHAALAHTLGGSSEIGDDGVVTVTVRRRDRIVLDGVHVSPEANISTNIAFLRSTRAARGPPRRRTSP